MLEIARKRLTKKKIINIEYFLGNGKELPFPDNKFDVIFMVTVLGEVTNQKEYIKEFYRVLKNSGILSIAEQAGDPDKMSMEEINNLLTDNNFTLYKKHGNKYNFNVIYKKVCEITD